MYELFINNKSEQTTNKSNHLQGIQDKHTSLT